jgi:hypothetical protein
VQAPRRERSQAQRALPAPASRARQRGHGRGPAVGDHGQTAVAAQHTRLVAGAGTHAPGARAWRSPRARQAQAGLAGRCAAGAARGADQGPEGKAWRAAGIPPSVARPLTSAQGQRGLCSQEDVTYHRAPETSQGPAGVRLTCRFATVEPGRPSRSEATSAGADGGRKPQGPCTKGGRRMTRWGDAQRREELAPRVRRRPEGMPRRKPRGEHPLGTLQRGGAAGDCFLRGRAKVRTECSWTVLASHLRRVLHRVERPRLRAALRGAGPVRNRVGQVASP